MSALLTTLPAVLARMSAEGFVDADDDALLVQIIATATRMAESYCNRALLPVRQTRYYDAVGDHIDPDVRGLYLGVDLLEAVSVTNGDGTVITADQFILRDRNSTPHHEIQLKASSGLTWTYDTDWEAAIEVDGVWGYHPQYADAWIATGDTVQSAVDAATQTFTVSAADGKDARYQDRFQVGMLLRIDDEFVQLVAVDTGSNQLTVLRGQQGTTAATHDVGVSIASYAPPRDIEQAVISLTVWLHRNGASAGDAVHFMADGSTIINNRVPSNISDTLRRYVWWGWDF